MVRILQLTELPVMLLPSTSRLWLPMPSPTNGTMASTSTSHTVKLALQQAVRSSCTSPQWSGRLVPLLAVLLLSVLLAQSSAMRLFILVCRNPSVFKDIFTDANKVCDYGPEGNVLGAFNTDVTKPLGNAGITATIS